MYTDDMEDDPGGGGASGSSHTHYQAPTMAGKHIRLIHNTKVCVFLCVCVCVCVCMSIYMFLSCV